MKDVSALLGLACLAIGGNAWAADARSADATPVQSALAGAQAAAAPLGNLLGKDGSLAIPEGFSGAIDPQGYSLVSKPGEAPRFAAKNPVDDPARWDPQFGLAIGCDGPVFSLAGLPDGRIVLGGRFMFCGNVAANRIAIWNPATGRFASMGAGVSTGANDSVGEIAVSGSDIYVGGIFSEAGGAPANNVARFNMASQSWSSLGTGATNGTSGDVRALAISGTDVYVGGFFSQAGGAMANNVARFDTVLQAWSLLGAGASNGVLGDVRALAVTGSDVYVGGFFNVAGGVAANAVARFNRGNGAWAPLGIGSANGVEGCAFGCVVNAISIADGDVFVGGSFLNAGGAPANAVARFRIATQTWSPLGTGSANGIECPSSFCIVRALSVSGTDVYVGSFFSQAGGVAANNVARFNIVTQAWSPLGTGTSNGVSSEVSAITISGSDVYVGGLFTQAGGAAANGVGRFSTATQSWSSLGAGAANGVAGPFSPGVNALATFGADVFVGGQFAQAGASAASKLARFNSETSAWSPLGSGTAFGSNDFVYAIAATGSDVYVGGSFSVVGGVPSNQVARFNVGTQTWFSLGTGIANGVSGPVYALAISGNDVYVGGGFTQAGDVAANNVARFNLLTQTWSSLGSGATTGVNGVVFAIAIAGNDIYVGGTFTQAGGATANGVARFNTIAQTWSSLGVGAANGVGGCNGFFGCVVAIAIAGSEVYVGGTFLQAGGATASRVGRFNTATQTWSPLGVGAANGLNGDARAIAVVGSDVYVGGFFTQAGGAMANNVARFNTGTQSWSSLGAGAANGVSSAVGALAVAGSNVYLGGVFTQAGANVSLRIARYDARRSTNSSVSVSPATSVTANTPVTFTGTIATTSFPIQPGTVEFLDNGAVLASCANQDLSGGLDTRAATCTTSALRVGNHDIVARYKGDSLNFIGTSDPVAISVVAPNFAFGPATLPAATFNTPGYSSGTITVSTSAGSGVIAPLTLQVQDAGLLPPGLTAAPLANGLLITGTPTQAGTFTFTVRATDSSTTSASGGPFSSDRPYTIVVARAPQTITPITRVDAVPLDNGVAFADGDFAVQASASSALPVAIDSTTPAVCRVVAPAFTVQPLQIGTCTLRARQIGNGNYEPAPEVLRTFQVKATPDTFVSSAPNPSVFPFGAAAPDPVVITATVETPGTATPTGTVRFVRAGNTIAGCAAQPLSGTGSSATATCTTTSLARGANALAAQYLGDALNVAATSNAATHQLNVGTATGIATITPSPCVVGQDCTVAVAVASPSGTPTGSVQVGSSTGGSCTVTLASGGGSCALTATTSGPGIVTATYLGSPPWLASPAATQGHPFAATVDELFTNGFEPTGVQSRDATVGEID